MSTPGHQVITDLFRRFNAPPPPVRLRDELVTHLMRIAELEHLIREAVENDNTIGLLEAAKLNV